MHLTRSNFRPVIFKNSFMQPFWGDDIVRRIVKRKQLESSYEPATNIIDEKDNYIIEMSVPGYKKDDFSIEFDKGVLVVSAEKKHASDENTNKYTLQQFAAATFKKSFKVATKGVQVDDLKANYDNGILRILLPKKEEVDTKMRIEVS